MNQCRVWSVYDGCFSPFNIIPSKNSESLVSTIQKINIPINTSIYLRGSYLESDFLFPNSDIDLVLISDNIQPELIDVIKTSLVKFNRSVEILGLCLSEVQVRHAFRLLLHTRSLHVTGPKIEFRPVKADLATMQDHYFQYKPHMLSEKLSINKSMRIMQLKQITRAYGILYFMYNSNVFSRDISTCLNWALELDSKSGSILSALCDSVDYPKLYTEYNLSKIISAFLRESKRAINDFTK
jgi:hypothetical protein